MIDLPEQRNLFQGQSEWRVIIRRYFPRSLGHPTQFAIRDNDPSNCTIQHD